MYMLDFIYLFKTQSYSLFDSADNPSKSHCQDYVPPLKSHKILPQTVPKFGFRVHITMLWEWFIAFSLHILY